LGCSHGGLLAARRGRWGGGNDNVHGKLCPARRRRGHRRTERRVHAQPRAMCRRRMERSREPMLEISTPDQKSILPADLLPHETTMHTTTATATTTNQPRGWIFFPPPSPRGRS
jgi:hypothetical protein